MVAAGPTRIAAALRQAERWLDSLEGVLGVAEGRANGQPCVTVFVKSGEVAARLPEELDGFPVVVEVEEEGFYAEPK